MNLHLSLRPNPYGNRCEKCKRVGLTVSIMVEGTNFCLCQPCWKTGVTLGVTEPQPAPKKKHSNLKRAQKYEQKIAEDIGGRAQPASGALSASTLKGDVRKQGEWRIEHKFTDALNSYQVKRKDLIKIGQEALQGGEEAALVFTFSKHDDQSYAVLPYLTFLELIDAEESH